MNVSPYPHFTAEEFARCNPSCKWSDMSEVFMNRLERCRELADIPFILNSAFRSVAWEQSHGRSGNSLHTFGHAVDIRCFSPQDRLKIVKAALECGFVRIGIGPNFVHLDDGSSNPCIWHYYNK